MNKKNLKKKNINRKKLGILSTLRARFDERKKKKRTFSQRPVYPLTSINAKLKHLAVLQNCSEEDQNYQT